MPQSSSFALFRASPAGSLAPVLLVPLIAGLWLHAGAVYAPCDDAYIYLVYVANLYEGHGLTYNGDPVQGFSSLLWPWLIAAAAPFTSGLPEAMEIASFAAGAFTLVATWWAGRTIGLSPVRALLPPAGLALTGDVAFYSGNGLETLLFAGLVVIAASVLFDAAGKTPSGRRWLLPVLALMILTRPEGALIAAVIVLHVARVERSWRRGLGLALALALALAPAYVATRLYYGSWLPATYHAKSGAGLANLGQGAAYSGLFAWFYLPIVVLAALAFVLRWRRLGGAALPVLTILLAWCAQVTIQGGDNMVGFRMYVAILPLVYLTIVHAFRDDLRIVAPVLICAFAALFWSYGQGTARASSWKLPIRQHIEAWRSAYPERKSTGLWLKASLPPGSTVALGAAGITPYFSGLPTIDMLGLNNRHIALHGKRNRSLGYAHQAGDGDYVMRMRPEAILLGRGLLPSPSVSDTGIWANPAFKADYTPCRAPSGTWIWIRNDTLDAMRRGGREPACRTSP
ncbi:hypothetical protein PQJ75_27445 [Rhodoplanes sp. TEM]|uniref:Glycosyltransferase RgtA/B/C/D-like domain-containing protein n=1 Tax=Rhodoplanes tepidamans TaxID=200616 RepID=A0ABT5JIS9_RHOTP|nr:MULTISPECIES: hypothetical protein [Rhodoplanes]MDC7789506.1 hypothetical protein [Rhodoplanes tepidamans]MDC7987485.1 hypothetical protein [Rhodoplanes sp. TEM]MDQ0359118.1 hypothetical protein [Rhodoplanes tepidamans]